MPDRFAPDVDVSAVRAWTQMQEFVLQHERPGRLQAELGLSPRIAHLLGRLEWDPMTLWDVALAFEVDVPMAQVVVDQLVRRGLVERRHDRDSPGATLVHVSDAGREASATAHRLLTRPPEAIAGLGAADLDTLLRILSTLTPDGHPSTRPAPRASA